MKAIGLISLARIIVIAFNLINVKLSTHYLSVKQLGLYFFLLTVSYFANALIFIPLDFYQQANLNRIFKETGGIRPLVTFNLKIIGYYSLLIVLIGGVVGFFEPKYLCDVILAAPLAVALYAAQALRNVLNNLGHKNTVSYNLIQEAVLKNAVFLLLITFLKSSEFLLIAALLVTLMASTITLYIMAVKYGLFRSTEKQTIMAKDVFHFSYPLSVGAIANWVQLQGYRLILVPLGFAEMVGVYATVAGVGSSCMSAVATIYSQAFSPNIYRSSGKSTAVYLRNATLLIGAILLGSILFSKLIITLTTRPIFEPYCFVMLFGVLTDATNLIIGGLAIHIMLTDSTKKIMRSSFFAILALAISFPILFFMKKINPYTIGIPLLLSQLTVVAYLYWSFRKTRIQLTTPP